MPEERSLLSTFHEIANHEKKYLFIISLIFLIFWGLLTPLGPFIGGHYNFAGYIWGSDGLIMVASGYKNIIIRLFSRP